ncbi:MAG: helix-turn-helix transcriptional regulator [Novosphingobium sp.]
MAITPTDETNLLLPLFEGMFEQPLWETFLRRLAQRTGAERVRLTIRNAAAPEQTPLRRRVLANRLAQIDDPGEPDPIDARVYAALRPNRVYAIDEIREFDPQASTVGDARLIRVAGRGDLNAWIVLLHDREAFTAADSALLTALAPPVATMLSIFAMLGGMRLRLEAAEGTLALLGIEQEILDRNGRVLGDQARSGQFTPQQSPALAEACLALAEAGSAERRILSNEGRDMVLRPTGRSRSGMAHPAAAVAMSRRNMREPIDSGARVLTRQYGLSPREAALAEALSRGVPLIEAGAALRLTAETTRNYSKRIYAKTGTSGQADLVRLVLEGLAVLA